MRKSGFGWGFAVGLVVAAVFAVVISLIPERVFTDPWSYAGLLLLTAVLAAPTVWMLVLVGRNRGVEVTSTVVGGMTGALAFDGIALSYWPGLYGQTGDALTAVATMLLFAFASIGVAAHFMRALQPSEQVRP